jgi:hypothetical protein
VPALIFRYNTPSFKGCTFNRSQHFVKAMGFPSSCISGIGAQRGSYHFNDKSRALPVHFMCIMPKVGKKNLSFFLLAINEILNEITVANYDIFHYLPAKI